jgi:hypothetical protein
MIKGQKYRNYEQAVKEIIKVRREQKKVQLIVEPFVVTAIITTTLIKKDRI